MSAIGRLQQPKIFQRNDGSQAVDLTVFVSEVNFLPTNKPATEKVEAPSVHAYSNQQFVGDEGIPLEKEPLLF